MRRFPLPTAIARGLFHARRVLAVSVSLGALAAMSPTVAAAAHSLGEPTIVLPGHGVRPGQLIDLRWTPVDAISELEILLSVDGGRHYTLCISPRLDPSRCHYQWRVPELPTDLVSIRIRFNRGGREIEGAPRPLKITAGAEEPRPLALPPAGCVPEGRSPRPGGDRGRVPAGRSASDPSESTDEDVCSDHSSSPSHTVDFVAVLQPRATASSSTGSLLRFVPLRT